MRDERRQSPRTTLGSLAYISIQPGNGGIVLNVSDGGLRFRSVVPVEQGRPVRFSIDGRHERMLIDGDVIWADEAGTSGGLRFRNLSPGVRDQMRFWATNVPTATENAADLSSPASRVSEEMLLLGDWHSPHAIKTSAVKMKIAPPSGFLKGLVTGSLFTALILSALLIHGYRQQIGESLIHLGRRLAPTQAASVPSQAASSPSTTLILPSQRTGPSLRALPATPARVSNEDPPDTMPEVTIRVLRQDRRRPANVSTTVGATAAPVISIPQSATAAPPNLIPDLKRSLPQLTPKDNPAAVLVETGGVHSSTSPHMFFDIGKFKHDSSATGAREKVSTLGLRAVTVLQRRLWMASYQVLVGPYQVEADAEIARERLMSAGFKPKPFERGSRDFTFSSKLSVQGEAMPLGDCEIKWESYIPSAVVKFVQRDDIVATAKGRWEQRNAKFERNAVVYERRPNGSRTLIELQFAGMNRALVFEPS